MKKVTKLCDINVQIFEWEEETNPKLRFNAVIDFEFPVHLEDRPDPTGSVGAYGVSASEAVIKLFDSNTVRKYIRMKAQTAV